MIAHFWRSYRSSLWIFLLMRAFLTESYGYDNASHNCAAYIAHYEKQHEIPAGLLQAISKVESGRKDKTGCFVAWPWTVNAEGKAYYFPTKEAAMAAVREMQSNGIQSVDVGCMQINLYHHPNAFQSLRDAFDPVKNVAYAASFLTKLKNEHASWYTAVSHYHSANPMHHIPYRKSVLNLWERDQKTGRVLLAAGPFEKAISSSLKISGLRRLPTSRLPTTHVARMEADFVHSAPTKAVVRRVTRIPPHSKRISSRSFATNRS